MRSNLVIFRIESNCECLVWCEPDGWHACLRWNEDTETDLIGPCGGKLEAIFEIKMTFINNYKAEIGERR